MILLLFFLLQRATAHVSLTYPQARFPPLDFLKTDMTTGPCGVPEATKAFFTSMTVGEAYNVTWRVADDSKAKHTLKLIDADGITVESFDDDDTSSRSLNQMVIFTKGCEKCSLLMERQEVHGVFRSCADVNVFAVEGHQPDCSGQGTLVAEACECETGFDGPQCQYLAHCKTDSDCMNGGRCITDNSALVQKKCYCSYGYFGQRCDQKFNSENDECFAYDQPDPSKFSSHGLFESQCYSRHDFDHDNRVYSRQIGEDVEVIMDFATSSWVSIAWRPLQLRTTCRLFPSLEDVGGKIVSRDAEARRKTVAMTTMPKNNGLMKEALEAPLGAMDCMDMIMADIKSSRLFVSDFYSRDMSTPLEDYWFDGEMSLIAAYGVQLDGRTVVMFRRNLREIEPTDHPLGPSTLFVSWAIGSDPEQVFKYHGSNRGSSVLSFCEKPDQKVPNNQVSYGVKNVVREKLEPFKPTLRTTTEEPTTTSMTSTEEPSAASNILIPCLLLIILFLQV